MLDQIINNLKSYKNRLESNLSESLYKITLEIHNYKNYF